MFGCSEINTIRTSYNLKFYTIRTPYEPHANLIRSERHTNTRRTSHDPKKKDPYDPNKTRKPDELHTIRKIRSIRSEKYDPYDPNKTRKPDELHTIRKIRSIRSENIRSELHPNAIASQSDRLFFISSYESSYDRIAFYMNKFYQIILRMTQSRSDPYEQKR